MHWIATITWARPRRRVGSVAFVVLATMVFAAPRCIAQRLQKGVSVELAVTSHAVAMPDADKEGAVIVAVTHSGNVYFGIDPITPAALAEKQGLSGETGKKLYVKADSRTPYANVTKVLDAVRKAGVSAPNLLTAQEEPPEPGKRVLPKGLEVRVGPPLPPSAEAIVVQMLNSGQQRPRVKITDEVIPWTNLEGRLRELYQNQKEKVVLLHADGTLSFGDIVQAIDVCRAMGAQVFLVTPAT